MRESTCIDEIASGHLNLDDEQCILFQVRRALSMTFFVLVAVVYIPYMCYGVYRIYFFRETIVMQKRHGILSQIIGIGYIVQTFIMSLVTLSRGSYMKWSSIGHALYITASFVGVCLNYITMIKVWIHFYDITFNRVLMLNSWTSIIANVNPRNMFWIKSRNTWGNIKYVSKRVIAFGLLLFAIILGITVASLMGAQDHIATLIANMVIIISLVIPIAFTLIIGVRLPSFPDNFSIKNETKRVCYTIVAVSVIAIIQQFTTLASEHVKVIGSVLLWFILCTSALIINYFVTLYVIKKNYKLLKQSLNGQGIIHYQATTTKSVEMVNMEKEKSSADLENKMQMTKMIRDPKGIQCLSNYLVHDFSIEIIASLIEMIQFKRCIQKYSENNCKLGKNKFVTEHLYEFPSSIVPESIIVSGPLTESETELLGERKCDDPIRNKIVEIKIRAHKIYVRYVSAGGIHEINVSDKERKVLTDVMRQMEKWLDNDLGEGDEEKSLLYLFNLFDATIDEMKELLEYSFVRLKASSAYKTYDSGKQ